MNRKDVEPYLRTDKIEHVTCGGEPGSGARPCEFRWVQELRRECIRCGVPFTFKQTGAVFIREGKTYHIERKDQMAQAARSGYSYTPPAPARRSGSYIGCWSCLEKWHRIPAGKALNAVDEMLAIRRKS